MVQKKIIGLSEVYKRINEALQGDLRAFIKYSFNYLRPGEEFISSWHLDAISHYLIAVKNRQIKRLIINMPPRTLKSLTCSVAYPAWLMGNDPTSSIICASYAQSLSNQHSLDCRQILESDWFKIAFPTCRLAKDQNEKSKYKTTQNGMRFATSVGGTLTGVGGSCFVGSTLVQTDEGNIPIELLHNNFKGIKVKSFNHDLDIIEYRPIIASKKSIVKGLYEIRTIKGHAIKCTGDHPIYIKERGYIEANRIESGEQVCTSRYQYRINKEKDTNKIVLRVCELQRRLSIAFKLSKKKIAEGIYKQLLRSSMSHNLYKKIYAGEGPSPLFTWNDLRETFQETKSPYQRERQTFLSSMQKNECKNDSTSYRSQQEESYHYESDNDVQSLSYYTPSLQDNTVSSVKRISDSEHEVYDIQVEGNHNFFANGILSHNCIIIDDPADPNRANSEIEREC